MDLCQYFGHKKLNFSPSITYAERIIGANKVSLNTAKKNYKLFGATEERFINMVRQPYENEI